MSEDINFVLQARRDKLDALKSSGVEPFAYSYNVTHNTKYCLENPPADGVEHGEEVSVAGRIVAWRGHGKTAFAHVADMAGKIQVYFRKDQLGDESFAVVQHLDLGDIVGIHGPLFRTKTGEVTIRVDRFELLAKSLRPLPFGKEETLEDGTVVRHSGFSDAEQMYRQRYADLAVHPEKRVLFAARSRMVSAVRAFLDGHGYLEVETPVLQPQYGVRGASAPTAEAHFTNSFSTRSIII